MHHSREFYLKHVVALGVLGLASISVSQSLNIDFNWQAVGGTLPISTYGAAGSVGVWNNANIGSAPITNFSLVDLGGAATSSLLNLSGFGAGLSTSGPWTGNDNALMEDSAGSASSGAVMTISGLLSGSYNVLLYGQSSTGNVTSTFVLNNVSQTSGGVWAGSHVLGNSYTMFSGVVVNGGSLTVNYLGNFNGVQLQYAPVPEPITMFGLLGGLSALGLKRSRRVKG